MKKGRVLAEQRPRQIRDKAEGDESRRMRQHNGNGAKSDHDCSYVPTARLLQKKSISFLCEILSSVERLNRIRHVEQQKMVR